MSGLKGSAANFHLSGGDMEIDYINDYDKWMLETFSKCFPTLPSHKIGSIVHLGTGGSMDRINEYKEIFTNPELYPIPPYWEEAKKIDKMIDIIVD